MLVKKDSENTRPTEQGPYGTTHGNAIGKVWNIGRQIEITVDDLTVVAGLLEEEAPLTCAAFLKMLPYKGTVVHLKWSGDGFQTHGHNLERMVTENNIGMENFTIYGSRGDIMFWVRDRGLFICYGSILSKGNTGEEPANLFAYVHPEYHSVLYKIGNKVYNEGKKNIFIQLLPNCPPK